MGPKDEQFLNFTESVFSAQILVNGGFLTVKEFVKI